MRFCMFNRGMRRGVQAPEMNSGDSPLSEEAPSFYAPLKCRPQVATSRALQVRVAWGLPTKAIWFAACRLCRTRRGLSDLSRLRA